jgi:hypothetical protein
MPVVASIAVIPGDAVAVLLCLLVFGLLLALLEGIDRI